MYGSKYKPNLKVRTLDEMFKKISESSENDREQLAHTSENSPALSLAYPRLIGDQLNLNQVR
jgi:hypothetical protein